MAVSRLYYTILSSQMDYSDQPTNALDISRLLQNRPAWRKPLGGARFAKKTIILDPSLLRSELNDRAFFTLCYRLSRYQSDGFSIYVRNKSNFYSFNWMRVASQEPAGLLSETELVTKATKALTLAPEQLFIISPSDRAFLFGSDADWEQQASFECCDLHDFIHSTTSLNHLFQQKRQAIRELDLLNCWNWDIAATSLDLTAIPTSLRLLKCDLSNTFKYRTDRYSWSSTRFPGIVSANEMIALLTASKGTLTSLELNNLTQDIFNAIPQSLKLPVIESLALPSAKISIQALQQLLQHSTVLKTLNLRNAHFTEGSFEGVNLPALESLDLSGSKISTQALQQLLQHSRALKILNLYNCSLTEGSFEGVNLPALESLDLGFSKISTQAL